MGKMKINFCPLYIMSFSRLNSLAHTGDSSTISNRPFDCKAEGEGKYPTVRVPERVQHGSWRLHPSVPRGEELVQCINKARHIYMKLKQDSDNQMSRHHSFVNHNNNNTSDNLSIRKSALGSSIGELSRLVCMLTFQSP
jgi:hypothetical protein